MPNARACRMLLLSLVTIALGSVDALAHDRMLPLEKMASQPKNIFVGTVRAIQLNDSTRRWSSAT